MAKMSDRERDEAMDEAIGIIAELIKHPDVDDNEWILSQIKDLAAEALRRYGSFRS